METEELATGGKGRLIPLPNEGRGSGLQLSAGCPQIQQLLPETLQSNKICKIVLKTNS